MHFRKCLGALSAALIVFGCRGSAPEQYTPLPDDKVWDLEQNTESLLAESCPQGPGQGFAMSFLLNAESVTLGEPTEVEDALDGVEFKGGWALSAPPASFGGLSGLKLLPSGDLLAISDGGAFVEIGFDQQALAPTGKATLSFMRNADGDIVTGKAEADSEGLELMGDIALVSFERDHRVLAFGYGHCGSNSLGIEVSRITSSPDSLDRTIPDNAGAEGLVLANDRLVVGLETVIDGLAPLAVIDAQGAPQFEARNWIDGEGVPLVGLDALGDTVFSLHRAYNPISGNTIHIRATSVDGTSRRLAKLARPLAVDNFEGIAVGSGPDGKTRLFIVSDDNFSEKQRTLLFVFELSGS